MNPKKKKKFSKKYKLLKILKKISCIKIQRAFRKYRTYWIHQDFKSRILNEEDTFNNNISLLGKNKENINKIYFYKNENFFYDIREIYKHIINSNKNPYTNITIPNKTIKQIKRIIFYLKKDYFYFKELDQELDENENLTNNNIISSLTTDLFLKMDNFIGVSNISIFKSLSEGNLYDLIEEIFNYNFIYNNHVKNSILFTIEELYRKYLNERNKNPNNKVMLKHKFNFNNYIIKLLHNIIDIKDDLQNTRVLLINENINEFKY